MKNCLYCGKEIVGRKDKKYCDDQCRNSYNNQMNSDASDFVRQINGILRKNRKILEDLLPPDGMTKVSVKTLLTSGFNFSHHTHLYTTRAGAVYTYCYEFGYLPLEGDFYLIVKRESK